MRFLFTFCILTLCLQPALADDAESVWKESTFTGLSFRELGPALTSGRIADFAVDPANAKRYFVAVCSGNVWRTENAGTTYEPVFDDQGSYSIGCVTLDPGNGEVVWVGTGENNSQRSVGYGDGVYRSLDGGDSWENMGLKESEHIGMIKVDPRDGNTVYVAAQGPLWRSGGDRGLYRTTDGGANWERILHISDDTGVSEFYQDPREPDTMYAVAYQRRRHVWVLLNGGPESGIHKSTDGGKTWNELKKGIPDVDKGRIGMAVSPVDPNVLYAVIEAQDDEGGFFRSTDAGASWEKRSDYNASSPQYYHEIFADPVELDRLYAVDTFFKTTDNAGESFQNVPINQKHVDDHAVWIDPADNEHLLVGCDGGIYETWDRGAHWNFKANLPVTQFYKIAVDDDSPFYSVYGGTQDNNTMGGYTRTTSASGIHNTDWTITLGGDGFEPQVEPGNPDIVYSQWQNGGLSRWDRRSGEAQDIAPQPAKGQVLKWNWSSALLISPHSPTRLYYGSNVLFQSDDRGDNWRQISPDLTRQLDRNQLKVMDRVWSVDAVAKNRSTSYYGNIVALAESPLVEGLIYAGTDDGLLHISANGGGEWHRVGKFGKTPEMGYVASLAASQHEADVVYISIDNHKQGDFAPYVLRSNDRGRSWKSIAGDLPERGTVYSVVEDHVDPQLLFVGTEFGAFFTHDGGKSWIQLGGGIPTIACRDLSIQQRENDLVAGTFGRGFWVLDDYSPLRMVDTAMLEGGTELFDVKDAWIYVERQPLGGTGKASLGDSFFVGANPPFGAIFSYYLHEGLSSLHDTRRESEKEIAKEGGDNPYPSWDELRAEDREKDPVVLLTVRDADGNVVRRIEGPTEKGFQRVAWDLRYPAPDPSSTTPFSSPAPWITPPNGPLAVEGSYSVEMGKRVRGEYTKLSETRRFALKNLPNQTLADNDPAGSLAFQKQAAELSRAVQGAERVLGETQARLDHLRVAVRDTPSAPANVVDQLDAFDVQLDELRDRLSGDDTISKRAEPTTDSISSRIDRVSWGWDTRMTPTGTQRASYAVAAEEFALLLTELRQLVTVDLIQFETKLEKLGAPWTPGRMIEWGM